MSANDPAYPTPTDAGLTKRELFAAMAMQGFAADPNSTGDVAGIAETAVKWSDALIAALEKTND